MSYRSATSFKIGDTVRNPSRTYIITFLQNCECGTQVVAGGIVGGIPILDDQYTCYCGKKYKCPSRCDWGFNCVLAIPQEDYLKTLDNL